MIYKREAFFLPGRATACSFIVGVLFAVLPLSVFAVASVTLTWLPSTDPNVVGYNVYFGGASETYTNKISDGNTTNAMVSGLAPGDTYYFAVTAYDNTGLESPFSNEASYAVPQSTGGNTNTSGGGTTGGANKPPKLNVIGNLAITENTTAQTVNLGGISSGAASETQTLTVTATSSNPALIPTPIVNYTSANTTGTLTFTPAQNAVGTATLTVTVNDGQAKSSTISRTFTVTVNPPVQPPTLNPISSLFLTENPAMQTVSLNGITPGFISAKKKPKVKITASSSNRTLVKTIKVNYKNPEANGLLTFKVSKNAIGTTTITVTANNQGKTDNLAIQTFTVTVFAPSTTPQVTTKTASLSAPLFTTPPPPEAAVLTPVAHADGQFTLSVSGSSDVKYVVQASTNLADWVPVWTNAAPFTYTDFDAGQFNQRFYRAVPAP